MKALFPAKFSSKSIHSQKTFIFWWNWKTSQNVIVWWAFPRTFWKLKLMLIIWSRKYAALRCKCYVNTLADELWKYYLTLNLCRILCNFFKTNRKDPSPLPQADPLLAHNLTYKNFWVLSVWGVSVFPHLHRTLPVSTKSVFSNKEVRGECP